MKALIADGKNAGRIVRLSESEIDLSDVLEQDSRTGAYRMTEADAQWLQESLREGSRGRSDFDKHKKRIALSTLKMSDVGANVMGGMSKKEAREFLRSIGYSEERIKELEGED